MTTAGRTVIGVLVAGLLAGATALARNRSSHGVGAEESLDDPVSVRHESIGRLGFFGSWTGRSHWGGGIKGGK
jgi:hypothetical protein